VLSSLQQAIRRTCLPFVEDIPLKVYTRTSRNGSACDWSSKRFRIVAHGQDRNLVALLICYYQETVARCNCEIARPSATAWANGNAGQSPIRFYFKDGYAVVSPIGDVHTVACWRDVDVGYYTLWRGRWQRLNDLPLA
jgi:hypothetical protein